MHDDAYLELCAAHALGSLDPADAVRLREHLDTGCTQCREELAQHGETVEQMGRLLPARTPPPGAEARLMSRIEAEVAAPKVAVSGRVVPPWALRTAAVVTLGIAGWMIIDRGKKIASLADEVRQLQQTTAKIERVVAAYELDGTENAPQAHGVAYIDQHDREDPTDDELMLHVTDLGPPPEDKVYTAWMISESQARPVGVIRPDEKGEGYASLKMPSMNKPYQIRVTLESGTGGVRQPAGPVILLHRPTGGNR